MGMTNQISSAQAHPPDAIALIAKEQYRMAATLATEYSPEDMRRAHEPPDAFDTLKIPSGSRPEVELLRTQQVFALEDLMAGKSHLQAAHAAGVTRRTLYQWIHHDEKFKAAMESWRRHATMGARDRLTVGLSGAARTLCNAAARGDVRAAMSVLKLAGIASPPAAPDPTARAATPVRRQRILEMRLRELLLSLTDAPDQPADEKPGDPSQITAAPQP